MENVYEILQVNPGATKDEIRKSYIKLAKIYHPDKNLEIAVGNNGADYDLNKPEGTISNGRQFVKVNHAWKVLSNDELRQEFDIKWKERCLHQTFPIQDNVHFSDFDFDEDDKIFVYPCRCGSNYILSETEAELLFDLVCCETCSLTIEVDYEKDV